MCKDSEPVFCVRSDLMKIYNTLTRQKEEFVPIEPGKARIYACGPTVYNFIHIGNARPICVFDTLRRYLEYRGYEVRFVQNFTDIDDKLINRANEEGTTVPEIAEKYIAEYQIDAAGLGVRPATVHPRATETIDEIQQVIATLVEKGYAYESDGSVYFRSRKFKEYGKLSHMPIDDLESGARVDVSEHKEDPLDFALWKGAKPGEPFWPSPWGNGRPGWHIECTAMIRKHLGETIDIHCGGSDLVFPHHENEIAQGECCSGKPYAHYWMHNGFINVDNHKMSKSLGNFFTTREVANKFGYEPIKFMMLQAHYRSPINYSYDVIEQCRAALERLYTCRDNLDFAAAHVADAATDGEEAFRAQVDTRRDAFIAAMDDDLNTADAIAALFELVRDANTFFTVPRSKEITAYTTKCFDELTDVLGLLYNRKKQSLDERVEALIEERQAARKAKNFKRADEIRDELKAEGIVLEDTPQGVKWRRA
jgi:cysteinyl-tRNA synthetase